MVYALDYLLNQLLEGDLEEKQRLIEKLEGLTMAVYESLIVPHPLKQRMLACLKEKKELPSEGGAV